MKKPLCALVTGASSGIGLATARALGKSGYHLILLARRTDRLAEIASEMAEQGIGVDVHAADVRDFNALSELARVADFSRVRVLVNNAGLARGTDAMAEANVGDWDAMIDTNVKGLLYMTRLILPHMIQAGEGHVVNVGSVAGRWVYPGGGVYCASKFAVRALSEGLRMDLIGTPIRVTNIEPGMVDTEFSFVRFQDSERARRVYAGMKPLSADDVADSITWCLTRPVHVNIQELVIFPTAQASVGMVHRSASPDKRS